MSVKTLLNKLTSMVLVTCMLLSLAAPAVGEEPLTQPTEETVYPEGSTVYADGTVMYADGTIVYADGTMVYADGTTVDAYGTTLYPDGTAVYVDGKIVYADGTTVYPDGTTVYIDGTVVYANGTIVYADGTTVHADGTTVDAYGTTVYPDGTAVYADGRIVYADGTTVFPDGTTVYADGTTVYPDSTTVYPDGTTIYPDGTTVKADGTTIYPDGTTVNADGSTLYPDGTTAYPDGTVLYADGTMVYPDGTIVYADGTTLSHDGSTGDPDGSTDSVLEEEQVPLAEPVISNADVVTENPKETKEPETTPANPSVPVDPAAETQPLTDGKSADDEEKTESAAEEVETGDAEGTENTETGDTETEDTASQDGEETAEPEEETDAETEEDSEKDQDEQKNVVRDVTLSGTLVDSDGYTYEVSVSYPADCGIPAGVQLSVEELIVGTDAYWAYINQSAAELGISPADLSLARAFDISFVDPETGEHYQPTKDVRVSILLISTPVNTEEELTVLHFDETGEVQTMDVALNGEAIEFQTGSFSVFTVLQKSGNDSLTEDGGETVNENRYVFGPLANAGLVFNGQAQALVTAGVAEGGTLLYALGGNGETAPEDAEGWTDIIPTGTGAGIYSVWYKVVGNEEYTDIAAQCLTATISPATFNPRVSAIQGDYHAESNTIDYTVVVETEGSSFYGEEDHLVTITSELPGLSLRSCTYTYVHGAAFPEGAVESRVNNDTVISGTPVAFNGFPLTVAHMYDGDAITLTYTAAVDSAVYSASENAALTVNTVTIDPGIALNEQQNIFTNTEDDTATAVTTIPYTPLTREYLTQDGSWAYWRVTVNPKGYTLGGGSPLTLSDTFHDGVTGDAGQSIDYSSVRVESSGSVSYDYSGNTGTFAIPDNTPAVITYRTHIVAQPGEAVLFRGTALLQDAGGNPIASATAGATQYTVVIYPSPSEASGTGTNYMLKLFVYADGTMQTGIPGAQFILMDANQRALEYRLGDNKGQPVTFTTGEDGYANIALSEEAGDISIEKNTGYYLEMIQAVDGYQKDNTLYSFMITDDPGYSSGGFYKYYNGDTMKVRLYKASAGLSVSIRFSGSYTMREDQQNDVTAVLQKWDEEANNWIEVERHPYSDAQWGAIKFNEVLYDETLGQFQKIYRVVEENQRPWDLPEDINLKTTYYCLINSGTSDPYTEPQSFSVDNPNDSVSIVIDNRYEESQLTIVKMDKQTGAVLPGAKFGVFKIVNGVKDGTEVTEYTTDAEGKLVIRGGEPFESEILYGIVETAAPEHYLLPLTEQWYYFYFCNDDYLKPSIKANLPAGASAVNLTETGDNITIDNQKETITIPVMKIWQGSAWPENTAVVVGLYQSVAGSAPTPVLVEGSPLTVTLTSSAPYNNTAFRDLPSRAGEQNITYSIKEESINDLPPLEAGYVQEYGISSAGVYVVRNKPATSLTVTKEWLDWEMGSRVTDEAILAEQSDVTFDLYRSTDMISDEIRSDGITAEEIEAFVSTLTKVRSSETFGHGDGWTMTINDLDYKDDLGNRYYYYAVETVPSFGDELYEVDETAGSVTIRNKIRPDTASLTVTKAALVGDPRPESVNREFEFTLSLSSGSRPIRSWQVYTDTGDPANTLTTDWEGKVTFRLKPEASITFTLPVGVTVSVTEAYDPEYTVTTAATITEESTADNGRTYTYNTDNGNNSLTYTNTLHVICKVVKDNGEEEPFETLSRALQYIRDNSNSFTSPWTVYMLEDYTIPATDMIQVQAGESLTLTTAPIGADGGRFPFTPPEDDPGRSFAIITRGGAGGSMLKNAGTLTLERICLDGASLTATGDGGLVNSTGTLNLNAGTTLRNSVAAGKGGAVYADGIVNMVDGVAITGNSAPSASALWLRGTLNMAGGSITGNTGAADGALVVGYAGDVVNLSGSPVISDNTNPQGKAANLYIGVGSDSIVNVVSPGLDEAAKIGITAMEGHMLIGEQFAMADFGQTENLNRFINDAYGYHGKLKDGTSTNIVWNGLTLTISKNVDPVGANPNDRFTITLSSSAINMGSYIIDGTLDYTVTPAGLNRPGRIVFRNVKAGDEYKIAPLPVGSYTITEAASNYSPVYTQSVAGGAETPIEAGAFEALDDCAVTVKNIRRLADVNLTKTLTDKLKAATETQEFSFTVKLTEAEGTAISGFTLADGITTDANGETAFTMSPSKAVAAINDFDAPVGAVMTITETVNPNYKITASAFTMPEEGEGAEIKYENDDNGNVFAFVVTDDGADVTFANVRKLAEIELSKVLVNKVSETESFSFTLTLTRADGTPAAGYMVYKDADLEKSIVTDENGQAKITFDFLRVENPSEENPSKSVTLTIPEGTKLEVEETEVKKTVGSEEQAIYDTSYSVNGNAAVTGLKATIASVSDNDHKIAFTNTRKTRTITVTNTVSGYSGNVVPFTYTATVTDGGEGQDDYDANGFTDGVMTFELTTGQSKVLTVPYGATLTVTEKFIVGYETTVKRGNTNLGTTRTAEFQVTDNLTVAFTNSQLIGLRLVNNTSSTLENVQVYVGYGTRMYRVNDAGDDQTLVPQTSGRWATLDSIEAGKTAQLEIMHKTGVADEQDYTVKGTTPAVGFYYTINNEPSFHETAKPAILRVYDAAAYEVKGKLRYSVSDSTVTFTEQPMVSFDVNGGVWTTEMEGYHDRDGDRKVYQKAVDSGETVARPTTDPVYPTAEEILFLGWTKDETFAKQAHMESEDVTARLYDFENTPVNAPITLYAIWPRDPNVRTVTVKNGLNTELTVTVTLSNNDQPVENYTLYEDTVNSDNSIKTDDSGVATFTLVANENRNLHVPNEAKLVLVNNQDARALSEQFEDSDTDNNSFTIQSVTRDGTVIYTSGICKITDSAGNILYDNGGQPAVYSTLADAFTAYEGTLYTDASHTTEATQAAVKMLVDEYEISSKHTFPNKNMTLTTAGKDDADFPFLGLQERTTLYRDSFTGDSLFSHTQASEITLTNIILDGRNVSVGAVNGGLINVNKSGAKLTIDTGTTMQNVVFTAYASNANGGAIYIENGTLVVNGGLFSNLHARQGGAIYAKSNALLNIEGTGIRFENCSANASDGNGDGGAIYYSNKNNALTINGGQYKDNPGIVFDSCVADGKTGDGGAIYASTSSSQHVSISGCSFIECSARDETNTNAAYGGGAICADGVSGLTVSYCSFTACDTQSRGGAVVVYVENGGEVSAVESSFERCNCKGQGGAMAVYQPNQEKERTDTRAKTKLSVNGCEFSNCSSGTNNGSGGAIQCYVPCMEFTDSTFADCWAGKEGGAINNYFGNGYTVMWDGSYLTLTRCTFIRCRAEDRYDPTALQHYGGGVNTKVKTVTVTDSYFEDCVSTLKEGGALHIGGQGGGSTATITGSTFKNCMAKNGGGALLSSHETLTIENSYFYGCSSSASNGGAVYHYKNSRGDSTQKYTTIKNSTFSEGCSAAQNGGAIWTRATTDVKLENLTIQNAIAGGNGGGVYLDGKVTKATLIDGSITGCEAANGSAVYVGNSATFSGELEVSGNTCSNVNSGAIHGGKLYFEGNMTVTDNTCSSDSAYDHDVLMQNDNVTTIYTTASGLGEEASIGVYVPDNVFNKRGLEGQTFGTYNSSNYLDAFFNDRNDELYGYQASANDTKIYWGIYICKITDADGNTLTRPNGKDAVYQRLTMAFDEFTQVTGGEAVYVKMLVERYNIRQTAAISNFPDADITLTTALRSDTEYRYRGAEGTVCTISRTSGTEQLFKLSNVGAIFQLENITLDGRNDKTKEKGDRRLIEAASGALVINSGTTMQYGAASNGGAIDAADNASVTIHGVYDGAKGVATVKFINCTGTGTNKPNGGAIRAVNLNIDNSSEVPGEFGTAFINCSAYNGGAISATGSAMAIKGAFFDNCHSESAGGAVYHNNSGAAATTMIKNCAFEECYTYGNNWAHGGAVEARAGFLYVEDCSFKDCRATSDGGAVYHGFVGNDNKPSGNRDTTSIKNTTFTGCSTTGTDTGYNFGGSVYTQAKTIEVIDSTFRNSTATNHGGALYCQSSVNESNVTVSGTRFENCATTRSTVGAGGAIYSRNMSLALQKSGGTETTISNCTAPGYSGAVYMATSGSELNISGDTLISGCYAKQGGAIYLKNTVTMNLNGSPEFTQNGYTSQDGTLVSATEGACIYLAQGSRINLSGSPKFSRNILPNQDRITNGGILDNVRQDIYLAGYQNIDATSIYVVGKLTGDTIWVWPEQSPHRFPNEQFAKIAIENGITLSAEELAETLSHFRNSLADSVTNCTDGEYLAGVTIGNDTENVYWDKMYTVSFKKIDNKGVAVPGAEFTLYKDKDCSVSVASKTSADGESNTDAQGRLLVKGTVEFTSVPIGAYYMKETRFPVSFKENETTYLVLVGTPYLSPNDANRELWEGDGPLNVDDAPTLVARHTTNAGRYYGIFPLDENNKAILRANLASNTVGIENIRNDYQVSFMKVDGSNKPLPGAAFTIYTAVLDGDGQPQTFEDGYPKLKLWSRDGETYPAPVVSADGTATYKDVDNKTLQKGLVYYRELPIGTYYLLETAYPERNGDGRHVFFAESDRVFRLDIAEDPNDQTEIKVTLSEWKPNADDKTHYEELDKDDDGYHVVTNQEVACKLTDVSDNLLFVQGNNVWERNEEGTGTPRLFPAVYPTLEEGFEAAQNETFVYANGETADVDALKLKVLKDFTIDEPITYSSERALTFTTAETRAQKDRYVFSTNRTSDASRAEIKRSFNGEALITVGDGASLTLQNIKLNGQKSSYSGRAIHVTNGSLTILNNAQLLNFRQNSAQGGAILMEEGTRLTVNGGSSRTAVFSNNEAASANGGAIAVGENCAISIVNAQFTGNKAENGNGGALTVDERGVDAPKISLVNAVFRNNTARNGGAIHTAVNAVLTVENGSFASNTATEGNGGAVTIGSNGTLTITGGSFTGNTAGNGDGGAVRIGRNGALTINGSTLSGNKADNGNGGAIFAGKVSEVTLLNAVIRSNSAESGSAIYGDSTDADEDDGAKIRITNGVITGNNASGDDGGAINVGGLNAIIFFDESPHVYGNYGKSGATQQKNVVLSRDSNNIIQTAEPGLTGGTIGVYVIDTDPISEENLFTKHGQATNPFGTFGDGEGARNNPQVFINDRNTELHGVEKEDDFIYWSGVAGSRRVILRKVQEANGSFQPKNNAVFDVDTDANLPTHAKGVVKTESSEETVELTGLTSGTSGILWIGELPYGVYYLKEISPQERTFILTVDENGVGYPTVDPTDPLKNTYSSLLRPQ